MRRLAWPLYAFLGWTVFVWAGRIRNGGSLLLAASFLVLAVVVLVRRSRITVALLAGWTIALWAVRTPIILANDHSAPFKVVHTILAVVSIGLAVVAQRHVERERQASASAAGLEELVDG